MRIYSVDLAGARTRDDIHDKLAQGLGLTESYGRNLDALHDVLTSMEGQVRITGIRETDDDLDEYLTRLRTVCFDADRENYLLDIVFD